MATIVHAADLHLDSPGQLPGTALATRRALSRLVDLVLFEPADLLVIAGDVFDRDADSPAAGRFFATQMDRLAAHGVPVLVAAGNHDAVCAHACSYPSNVRWFPTEAATSFLLDDLGVAVHGQGLADPTEPADLSAAFPSPVPGYLNLGVLHTSLDGARSRTICAPSSVPALAAQGYDYWALGHVHQRRVVSTDPWIVFSGNLQGRGPAEPGRKGATVLTTSAGMVTRVEHREVAAWHFPLPPASRSAPAVDRFGEHLQPAADLGEQQELVVDPALGGPAEDLPLVGVR